MAVFTYLDVCTANIMPSTMALIEAGSIGVTSVATEYGAFVMVFEDQELSNQVVQEAELKLILEHAHSLGCYWVYFDPMAEKLEGFADYSDLW